MVDYGILRGRQHTKMKAACSPAFALRIGFDFVEPHKINPVLYVEYGTSMLPTRHSWRLLALMARRTWEFPIL
jgi:hypothetical protein